MSGGHDCEQLDTVGAGPGYQLHICAAPVSSIVCQLYRDYLECIPLMDFP